MCLLVVGSRLRPDMPLVLGANRDERLDRAATPMETLATSPTVLGGRDHLAGGTWLAVNEHGVVAAITNRPAREQGRDPTKRSRGELPLVLASHASARDAVAAFAGRFSPSDFNPAWLFVADRNVLFSVDMTEDDVDVVEHGPGLHIFENATPGTETAKVVNVHATVARLGDVAADDVESYVASALASHDIPAADRDSPFAASRAACVHSEEYGTRWSGIVIAGSDPDVPPRFRYAPGQPCTTPFVDASWG
jgi:uncharacterized protein with NRDE domain